MNIPCPFRALLCGGVGSGKTTCVKNIIMQADPAYDLIILIHCSPEYTSEYDDLGSNIRLLRELPTTEELAALQGQRPRKLEGDESDSEEEEESDSEEETPLPKTLIILDDLKYKGMRKAERGVLNRIFGYASSHMFASVCITSQTFFRVPPDVRQLINLHIIWRIIGKKCTNRVANELNIPQHEFLSIFRNVMHDGHDCLWIDSTRGTPFPRRKNGHIELVGRAEGEERNSSD